jgi:hypothetical protein
MNSLSIGKSVCPSIARDGRALKFMAVAWFAVFTMPIEAAVSEQSSSAAPANEPAAAVWQAYDLNFHYFASGTYYNCSALETRLETMLRQLGAEKAVRATVTGCFGTADVGNMLSARIHVRMPTLAGDAPAESFMATTKTIRLSSGRTGDSSGGDCELLEQVRDQILPTLKLKVVKDDLNCIPNSANPPGRSLQIVALVPEAPKK